MECSRCKGSGKFNGDDYGDVIKDCTPCKGTGKLKALSEKENFMEFIKENELEERWQEWNSHN